MNTRIAIPTRTKELIVEHIGSYAITKTETGWETEQQYLDLLKKLNK